MKRKRSYHFKNFTPKEWSEHQKKTHSTKSFKRKQSESVSRAWQNRRTRKRFMAGNIKGNSSRSKTVKAQWQDPIRRKKRLEGFARFRAVAAKRKTGLEAKVEKILSDLGYSYTYTGSLKGLECRIANYRPDFTHTRQRRVIEVFGTYWHSDKDSKIADERRIECFKNYGYKVLVIREAELSDVLKLKEKIVKFHRRM